MGNGGYRKVPEPGELSGLRPLFGPFGLFSLLNPIKPAITWSQSAGHPYVGIWQVLQFTLRWAGAGGLEPAPSLQTQDWGPCPGTPALPQGCGRPSAGAPHKQCSYCGRHTCRGPALTCVACGLSGPSTGRVSTGVQTTQARGHTALGSYLGAAIDLGTGFCALGVGFFT